MYTLHLYHIVLERARGSIINIPSFSFFLQLLCQVNVLKMTGPKSIDRILHRSL